MIERNQITAAPAMSSWQSPFLPPPAPAEACRRVLIVTGHREQARALGGLLWASAMEAVGAPDVATALVLARHLRLDALVVDTALPTGQLRALCATVRRWWRGLPPPIVGLSACYSAEPELLADLGLSACCTTLPDAGVIVSTLDELATARSYSRPRAGIAAALIEAMQAHSPETAGHMRRVAEIAAALGRQMGLSQASLRELIGGALLHDIGKLCVPRALLHKPGSLTLIEQTAMRNHPLHGVHILAPAQVSPGVLAVVRSHHERYDGQGYPDHSQRGATPLAARIVSVADAYDAMTTIRPYSVAVSRQGALTRLVAGAGSYWDPDVVAAMRDLIAGRRPTFYSQVA